MWVWDPRFGKLNCFLREFFSPQNDSKSQSSPLALHCSPGITRVLRVMRTFIAHMTICPKTVAHKEIVLPVGRNRNTKNKPRHWLNLQAPQIPIWWCIYIMSYPTQAPEVPLFMLRQVQGWVYFVMGPYAILVGQVENCFVVIYLKVIKC